MTSNIYRTIGTYVVAAADTAWGTAGSPAGSNYVDRVLSFTHTIENNPILTQGIGVGANYENALNGGLDVTGEMTWLLTDADFLKYCFIGTRTGAGSTADPYIVTESDTLGYGVGDSPSVTLHSGKIGADANDVLVFDGVCFESVSITGTQGESNPVTCTGSFFARDVKSGGTAVTYSGPTSRAFCWIDSSVTQQGNTVGECTSFNLTVNSEFQKRRELGNRRLIQPVLLRRRYSLVLTMRLRYNATAGILSGVEARGLVFDGSTSAVGTSASFNGSNATQNMSLLLTEDTGASGDRKIEFNFSGCYFQNLSEPVELDNGDVELTLNVLPKSGLSNQPIKWWTVT